MRSSELRRSLDPLGFLDPLTPRREKGGVFIMQRVNRRQLLRRSTRTSSIMRPGGWHRVTPPREGERCDHAWLGMAKGLTTDDPRT